MLMLFDVDWKRRGMDGLMDKMCRVHRESKVNAHKNKKKKNE